MHNHTTKWVTVLAITTGLAVILWIALSYWQAPPVEIRALFLGDNGHHNPADRFDQLEPVLSQRGIGMTYTDDLADLNSKELAKYDVLIIYANHQEISEDQEKALLDFVERGGGFVPIHCASFCFLNSPQYIELVGAQFKSHETGVFRAAIVDPTHPATEGVEEFETWDETYIHHKHNSDRRLLMVRQQGEHQEPWSWTRTQGRGRVFYTAYGHDHRTWSNPAFHRLIEQAIRWVVQDDSSQANQPALEPFQYVEAAIPYYRPGRPGVSAEPLNRMQLPLSPNKSMKHMRVPPGFEVKLFAAEPDIAKPLAMAWDERGRLWIAETADYPNQKQPEGKGNDRIKICEDTDGDGRADKFTIFAEKLSIPTSLVFADGGMIVSQPPEMLFLRDIDGDDRADERRVLFSGWEVWDTHAGPSNLRWGFDNWIWGTVGYSGFKGRVGGQDHEFRQGIFRFRPDGSELEFLGSTSNNTWGLGFSEEGFVFASTANNQHSLYLGIPNRYYEFVYGWSPGRLPGIAEHWRYHPIKEVVRQVDWHDGYTAAAGHAIYTARNYPKAYWNRVAFVNEPTGSLLHKCVLRPQGSHFVSHDAWNFLASDDEWTAPIAAEVGPDGMVWMIDWYNYIVQHNPTPHGFETGKGNAYEIPLRDKKHGRVYRLVYQGSEAPEPMHLESSAPDELVAALKHENLFWRITAQRLLHEREKTDVLPQLFELVRDSQVDEIGLNVGAIHALWTLNGLGELAGSSSEANSVALDALEHPSAAVRKTAVQVLPRTETTRDAILRSGALRDTDAHVRLASLLALSEMPASPAAGREIVAALNVAQNIDDRWIPDGITAAAARHSSGFLEALGSGLEFDEFDSVLKKRVAAIVRLVAADYAQSASLEAVVSTLASLRKVHAGVSEAVLEGLASGWPAGRKPDLSDADRAELSLLLDQLPPGSRDRLLLLADRWGRRDVFSADVPAIMADLRRQITDTSLPDNRRAEAAKRLIRLEDSPQTLRTVLGEITPQAPPSFSAALLNSLTESSSRGVAALLIDGWRQLTPSSRQTAVSVLMRRPEWTITMIEAIEKGEVDPRELDAEQMQQLSLHSDQDIARRARRLAASMGRAFDPDRQEVVDRLLSATGNRGDVARGKLVFEENCMRCHTFDGRGGEIGPQLTGIGSRSRADILVDILDPNRSVEGNYRLWIITTKDGQILTGRLDSETQTTVEVLESSGQKQVIPRQEIAQIRASRLSIMPDGFEEHISQDDLASLLEYLAQRR